MTPERWQQVKGVLQEALELSPEQRPAFLDRACSADHSLRREVESLLSSSNDVRSSFMQSSPNAGLRLNKGTRLGDFEILSLLGAGGMGEVYRARDRRLDRDVALKVLPRFVAFDPERLHRFEQEAKAAAALNHPNILAVFQMGTYEGAPYLVSELLEGETLREQLKHGPIPLKKAIDYGAQISRGLAAAHEKRIVHRDLKPENLLVTRDARIKILDFGLAKLMYPESETQLTKETLDTEPGAVLGTVGYMSPEQVRGQIADHRSDIFAFGAILYEMLSGKRAFHKPTSVETMNAILNEDPPALSQVVPNLSPGLQGVVQRCLEKIPEQRFQSASDLVSILPAAIETQPNAPAPIGQTRKTTLRAAFAAGTLLALSALSIGLNVGGLRDRLLHGVSSPTIRSLAVLPLANLTGDAGQDYFVDGMTDELTTDLAQIAALRVTSRTSTMQFKDAKKPLPQIAKELNVEAVVEGSVVRSQDRVRITAQLIEASSDRHLWAKSYERKIQDVLALQDEVALDIAEEIRVKLKPEERTRLTQSRSVNPGVLEACLKGRFYYEKQSIPAFQEAVNYYRQAVAQDAAYAPAYVGLAAAYKELGVWTAIPPKEASSQSTRAVERALALDDTLGDAHAVLGHIHFLWDWDWPGADREYKRAFDLGPPSTDTSIQYAVYLSAMGRHNEAVTVMRKARASDPVSQPSNGLLGIVYYWSHRFDEAAEQFHKNLTLHPDSALDHGYLGRCYERTGMYPQALDEYLKGKKLGGTPEDELTVFRRAFANSGMRGFLREELKSSVGRSKSSYFDPYWIADLHARLGEKDQAFEWLERAYNQRSHNMAFIDTEPMLDDLHSDPRFQDLLRRMNLPR